MENASSRYKTAQAKIACAHFPVGAFVSVEFDRRADNGVIWYKIAKSEFGEIEHVYYPAHHLTNFTF